MPAGAKRMAAGDPANGKPCPAPGTMGLDRLACVLAAGRLETAPAPEVGRHRGLIEAEEEEERLADHASGRRRAFRHRRRNSARRASKLAVAVEGRPMNRIWFGVRKAARCVRKRSRNLLRARFRSVAWPMRRGERNPARAAPGASGAVKQMRVRYSPVNRRPFLRIWRISEPRRMRRMRGRLWSIVRRFRPPRSPGWLHFRCQAFASLVTAATQECPPRLGSRPIEKTVVSAPHPLRGLVGAFH
jgi:hypothetical protein